MHIKQYLFPYLLLLTFSIDSSNIKELPHFDQAAALNECVHYLPHNPIILECGGFDGGETITMSSMWPKGTIYTFEPVPELFAQLKNNTQACTNINAYQLALGDFIGSALFHTSAFPEEPEKLTCSGSLLAPEKHVEYNKTIFEKKITVPVTTLDQWAHENQVTHIDLLWLDMQGYELATMKASPHIMKTVKVIFTEVEFVEAYKGQPLYDEVKAWLEQEGFEMVARDFTLPLDVPWGNALFVRR